MSEFSSEKSERFDPMGALREASVLIRQAAEPRPIGDSVKAAIGRAARRLGFGFSRTKDIWYANARRIHAEEMDRLRSNVRRLDQERRGRADAKVAIGRLVALRSALAAADADFHRETLAALDDALRAMGAPVGAVAVPEV